MSKSYKDIVNETKSAQQKKDFVKSVQAKYGSVSTSVDPEEFPDKSSQGLEGPFRFKNGSVLYYDSKEGKYYDSKQDHFVDPPKQ
jgi:hypothetical protein